jgi:hypothetical protein
MPRSLAAWTSMRRSSVARPALRQPGVTAMAVLRWIDQVGQAYAASIVITTGSAG